MRNWLLLLTLALIFSTMLLPGGQMASVAALGAPSDNITTPSVPTDDQSHDEIKPPVEYVLMEPSIQSAAMPPNLIAGFITTSGQKEAKVSDDENWYLDLDINAPGWIYIYEYSPVGQVPAGQWLVYKWQLSESGLWRVGPFTPSINEPEGQHIYRIWFYNDGQWAAGDPETPQSIFIHWTYFKDRPAQPVSSPVTTPPTTEVASPTKVYEFFTRPALLGFCLLLIVAGLILLVIYIWRRRGQQKLSSADESASVESSAAIESAPVRARLVLPNGLDIRLSGSDKIIGRGDLSRALSLDDLALISRQHFKISSDKEQFHVEDLGSANGTRLNGKDISGKGPVSLNDDDIVEPAGAVTLKFHPL